MDRILAERLVRTYIDGWKEYDTAKVLSVLDPACVLIESHGQVYRGAEKIIRELEQKIAGAYGPWHINRWDITSLAVADDVCVLEWVFDGHKILEGASVVRFAGGKLVYLREYRTTEPLWEEREEP